MKVEDIDFEELIKKLEFVNGEYYVSKLHDILWEENKWDENHTMYENNVLGLQCIGILHTLGYKYILEPNI